jgi:DNA-directed RNA polymerase subunit RPC12/RpoP
MATQSIVCPACGSTKFNVREIATVSRVTAIDAATDTGQERYGDIGEVMDTDGWACEACGAKPDNELSELLYDSLADFDIESVFA